MAQPLPLRTALKRGALVAAANWQVIVVQFVAETLLKVTIAVPVLAGVFLVAVDLGADAVDLLQGDLLNSGRLVYASLRASPVALAAFLAAVAVATAGAAIFTFIAKAGTVRTLVAAESQAGPIEQPPLRWAAFRGAEAWSIDGFLEGCRHFARRYVRLGLVLLAVYLVTGVAYLSFLYTGMRVMSDGGVIAGWPFIALAASSALIVWVTLVNLVYILIQMIMAADDIGVRAAAGRLARFAHDDARQVAGIFGVVLLLILMAAAASLLAAAGLGLIGFVPFVGFAVLPLQVAAWLLRGVLFQFLGLTAFTAYLAQYRRHGDGAVARAALRSA
ncbi:MAG TPA: hypothetical protein VMN81_14160 [Vicinamibacterales bacterium]|nr:hypothetical protein [Vicinamibacterales bacterium]